MTTGKLMHKTLSGIGAVCLAILMIMAAVPLFVQATASPLGWFFDTDGNNEGWQGSKGTVATSDGLLKFTNDGSSSDPYVVISPISINASDYTTIKIGIVVDATLRLENSTKGWSFYFKNSSGTLQSIVPYLTTDPYYHVPTYNITSDTEDGDIIEVTIDLSAHSGWTDTITYLRFDAVQRKSNFAIDYIVLNNGEDVVPPSPAPVQYKAVQASPVQDDKFNVRFIATVDALTYDEVGLEITANHTQEADNTYHYDLSSGFTYFGSHTAAYADSHLNVTVDNSGGTEGAFYTPALTDTLSTDVYGFVIIKAKNANGFKVYFKTDGMGSYTSAASAEAVVGSITDSDYSYYVVDFSNNGDWNGNIASFMIRAYGTGASISDISVSSHSQKKDLSKSCSYVYNKLSARTASGISEYTAEDLGGKFLMALSVIDVPANTGIISFEVRPYSVADGVKSYGDKYIVVYNNGVFQSQNKA